jgi:predicted DNA-binding transcriptional regulator AlpA
LTHAPHLRAKARELRAERSLTIDQLAARLALSRSTIYHWVRDLPIPGSGPGGEFPESARRKGTRAMQAKYRRLREDAYEDGRVGWPALAAEPTFRDFVCLYIAEGYKRNDNVVSICNSDAAVVRVAHRWLRALTSKPLMYRLQYHVDEDVDELTRYWGEVVGVDPETIRPQRKSNSGQLAGRTWRSRYGVFSVTAHDTLLRARLEAWMDLLRESWA